MPSIQSQELLDYAAAVVLGTQDSLSHLIHEASKIALNPSEVIINDFLIPIGLLVHDAIVVTLDSLKIPSEIIGKTKIHPVSTDKIPLPQAYTKAAWDRMQERYETAINLKDQVVAASGPERARMATTVVLDVYLPSAAIKLAQGLAQINRTGQFNPTMYRNRHGFPTTLEDAWDWIRYADFLPERAPVNPSEWSTIEEIRRLSEMLPGMEHLYSYVIMPNGEFRALQASFGGHPNMTNCGPILMGGDLVAMDGKIILMDNRCGNYIPYLEKTLLEYVMPKIGVPEVLTPGVLQVTYTNSLYAKIFELRQTSLLQFHKPHPLPLTAQLLAQTTNSNPAHAASQAQQTSTAAAQSIPYVGIFLSKGSTEIQMKCWFRGESRAPNDIFPEGFSSLGNNTDLVSHTQTRARDSAYVSTTTTKSVAFSFPDNSSKGFVYEIRPQQNAIHIAEAMHHDLEFGRITYEEYTMVQSEKEMAVPSKINTKDIRGVWEWERVSTERGISNIEIKSFTPNPNYVEVEPYPRIKTAIRKIGHGITAVGIVLDGASLYQAFQQSQQAQNYAGFFHETARVIGAWSSAVALGSVGGRAGAALLAPAGPLAALTGGVVGGIAGSVIGYIQGGNASQDMARSFTHQPEYTRPLPPPVPVSQLPAPEPFARVQAARSESLYNLTRYTLQQTSLNPQIPSLFHQPLESRSDRQARRDHAVRDSLAFLGVCTDAFSLRQAFSRAERALGSGESLSLSEFLSTLHLTGLVGSYNNAHPSQPINLLFGDNGMTGGVENEVAMIHDLPNSVTHATAKVYYICVPEAVKQTAPLDALPAPVGPQLSWEPVTPTVYETPGYRFEDNIVKTLIAEVWSGYAMHGTYPFFSLHFNKQGFLYPIIHPAYQRTLTGETISLLDNWLKSALNGFAYSADFLKNWHHTKNLDEEWLGKNTTPLSSYFKNIGVRYHSLRELMSLSGIDEEESTGVTGHYSQPFQVAFRIIATNQIKRHNAILLFQPDFRIEYDITPMPDRQAALDSYFAKNGHYPEYYEKTKMIYHVFAEQIKKILPLLPESESYFAILGLINSLCYTFTATKKMGLRPKIPQVAPGQYAVPKAFPPIPIEYFITINLGLSFKQLMHWLKDHAAERSQLENIFLIWFHDVNQRGLAQGYTLIKKPNEFLMANIKALKESCTQHRHNVRTILKIAGEEFIKERFEQHGIDAKDSVNQDELEKFAENALQVFIQIHKDIFKALWKKTEEIAHSQAARPLMITPAFDMVNCNQNLQTYFTQRLQRLSQDWAGWDPDKIYNALLENIELEAHDTIKTLFLRVPKEKYREAAQVILTHDFQNYKDEISKSFRWFNTFLSELLTATDLPDLTLLEKYSHKSKQCRSKIHKTKISGGTCLEMPSCESKPIEDGVILAHQIGSSMAMQSVTFKEQRLCVIPIEMESIDVAAVDSHFSAMSTNNQVRNTAEQSVVNQTKDAFGHTTIHYAANFGDTAALSAQQDNLEKQNTRGATAMTIAVQGKQINSVKKLVELGANINHTLPNGLFSLYIAIQYHDEETALFLLDSPNVDLEGQLDTQMTPLLAAMEEGLWAVAEKLIQRGAILTKPRQKDGYTAIHLAASLGRHDLLKIMQMRGANLNLALDSGATCFHIACEAGNKDVINYLCGLSKSDKTLLNLDALNDRNETALMLAIQKRHIHLKQILEEIAQCSTINLQNALGQTTSMLAVRYGLPTIADIFLERGEDPHLSDHFQQTYVDYLIRQGELSRLQHFIKSKHYKVFTEKQLELAARSGQFLIASTIYKMISHFEKVRWMLPVLMQHAIRVDEIGFFRLFQESIQISLPHPQLLARDGSLRALNLLWADIPESHQRTQCRWILKYSIISGNPLLVQKVLDKLSTDELKNMVWDDGITPLHLAVQVGSVSILTKLLETGLVMKADQAGCTPLDLAIDFNDVDMATLLIKKTKRCDWPAISLRKKTHLSVKIKKWLTDYQVDVDKCGELPKEKEEPATHQAVLAGNLDEVKRLVINKKTDTVDVRNQQFETPLMCAARTGNIALIEYLLEYRANVNVCDRLSRTALHHAFLGKSQQAAYLLRPLVKNPIAQDREGLTPLMIAAQLGLSFIIHPNETKCVDKRGLTALHYVIIHGHAALIKPFVEGGFSPNEPVQSEIGETPLQLAVRFGKADVFDALLRVGANPFQLDKAKQSLCFYAVLSENRSMMLKIFADYYNSQDILFAAATTNYAIIIDEWIVRNQSLCEVDASSGLTALHIAALRGSAEVLQKLIPFISIDITDREGNTALHYAAMQGEIRCVRILLAANASLDCKNLNGKNPLDLAKEKDQAGVLALLQRLSLSRAIEGLGLFANTRFKPPQWPSGATIGATNARI